MTTVDTGRAPATMTLVAHLVELRRRLFVCLAAVAVGAVVAYILAPAIISFLVDFYRDATDGQRDALVFTGPLDAFTTRLKIATYGGFVLALPVILWQTWRFVTPGLHPRERRYAVPFLLASLALFALGAALALFTLPKALEFLLGVGGAELQPLLTADRYVSLVALMVVAFGVSFQFPVLLMFLLLAGVVSTAQLRRARRYVAVGVVAFAAIITPSQDPFSLLAMAVPMYAFYEACILGGRLLRR
ncbi:MAG: twin-arginine translocase subunit TatC [Acidimicrobiia bacterium]